MAKRSRKQLTLGHIRRFTHSWPDSTKLIVAESLLNLCEPVETQEFICEEELKVVALDDGGNRQALRIGYKLK